MPQARNDLGQPLLDLRSYGRRGPGHGDHLSAATIQQIARTVRGTPEVMIKALPRGIQDLKSIQKHLAYLDRGGEVDLETDDGERINGQGGERRLVRDWDLDVDAPRRRSELVAGSKRAPSKLVHKLMFSMHAGTPADKVLAAVRVFAREEFGLTHRYALALHTDEPHPHVHMVVKAVSEQGVRLYIRKATLRTWRSDFARHLRDQGVEANATERSVRGVSRTPKLDGIYRASLRRDSTHMRARVESAATELSRGSLHPEPGKPKLLAARSKIERGWRAVSEILQEEGHPELAVQVRRFVAQMPPPETEGEQLAAAIQGAHRAATQEKAVPSR